MHVDTCSMQPVYYARNTHVLCTGLHAFYNSCTLHIDACILQPMYSTYRYVYSATRAGDPAPLLCVYSTHRCMYSTTRAGDPAPLLCAGAPARARGERGNGAMRLKGQLETVRKRGKPSVFDPGTCIIHPKYCVYNTTDGYNYWIRFMNNALDIRNNAVLVRIGAGKGIMRLDRKSVV